MDIGGRPSEEIKFRILDLEGRIKSDALIWDSGIINKLDMSLLNEGVYVLEIKSGREELRLRLVKMDNNTE